jgi:hypothetical protein
MIISFGLFASHSLIHSVKASGVLIVGTRTLTSVVKNAGVFGRAIGAHCFLY